MKIFLFNLNYKKLKISYLILSVSLISYFYGFYIREISNGAAHTDLQLHIWLLVNDFKLNFYETLNNYLSYKEATFPFYHIFQSKLNPFLSNYIFYTLSNSILNLGILIVFFYFINKKQIFTNTNIPIILCSIFLLSPWFRSTSFWGTTENFALFFAIPACFYLGQLFENSKNFKKDFLLILFLSLSIYSRQQYLFLVFSHIFFLILFCERNRVINNFLIYFALSIPGLITYYIWGVFDNLNNATSASDYISLNYIFKNIPKISTLLFFYILPIIFLNLKKIIKITINKNFTFVFLLIFILKIILFLDIEYPKMGGGYIIKFNYFFLDNNMYMPIFISSLFFSLLIVLFKKKYMNYYFFVLCIYIIVGLPDHLYQEWFDPFYLIAYYLLLPKNWIISLNLNKYLSAYVLYVWEFCILLIAFIYYHFYLKIPLFYSF